MLTPKQLKSYDFQSVARNAYKATDVDAFMEEVYKSYEQMFRENAELIKKLNLLADKISHYKEDEDSIRNAMVEAQKLKNSIVEEAKAEATERITAAKAEAQAARDALDAEASHIVSDAQEEADSILAKANADADELLANTNTAAEKTLSLAKENAAKLLHRAQELYDQKVNSIAVEAAEEKKKLLAVKSNSAQIRKQLLEIYKTQMELIEYSPDYEAEVASELAALENGPATPIDELSAAELLDEYLANDTAVLEVEEETKVEDYLDDEPEEVVEDLPAEEPEVEKEVVIDEAAYEEVEEEKIPTRTFFNWTEDDTDINDYLDDED